MTKSTLSSPQPLSCFIFKKLFFLIVLFFLLDFYLLNMHAVLKYKKLSYLSDVFILAIVLTLQCLLLVTNKVGKVKH